MLHIIKKWIITNKQINELKNNHLEIEFQNKLINYGLVIINKTSTKFILKEHVTKLEIQIGKN